MESMSFGPVRNIDCSSYGIFKRMLHRSHLQCRNLIGKPSVLNALYYRLSIQDPI